MKKQLTTLTLALAMLVPFTSFAGGNSGGGGGGICLTNNKCLTLAQAGFRVKDTNDRSYSPLITEEVIAELDFILSSFPKQVGLKSKDVLGLESDIVDVEISDPRKLSVFLQEYKAILEANGATDLAKTVELMAFSASSDDRSDSKKVTYLIRGKFDALNPRGRALILIHEYLIRRGFPLKSVLSIDGSILDYLSAVENNQRPEYFGMIRLIEMINPRQSVYANAYMLNEAIYNKGPVSLQDLDVEISHQIREYGYYYAYPTTMNFYAIQKLKKTNPKMKYVKEDQEILAERNDRTFNITEFKRYLVELVAKSPSKKIKVTNGTFDQFLKENGDEVFKICGDKKDKSTWYLASKNEGLALPYIVTCDFYSGDPLVANLNGVNLDLQKDLTCTVDERWDLTCK